MTVVTDRKNRRAFTLPLTGRAITLVFLQTVATLIALFIACTGGGKRFRRLARKDTYERDLLEAAIAILWRKGRFALDTPVEAMKRLVQIVVAIAFHSELASRQIPCIAEQRQDACAGTPPRAAPVSVPMPDDSS